MKLEYLQKRLIDIKSFLDTAVRKDKLKTAKSLGLGSAQFNKMVEDGITQIVIMARDNIIMNEFLESKGLIEDMNLFHNAMIEQFQTEEGDNLP